MKEKILRFFANRYGHDYFNYFLLIAYLIVIILSNIFDSFILSLIALFLICYSIYRSMSRNFYARSKENRKFMDFWYPYQQLYKAMKNSFQDKTRKYFVCPKCHQVVRVPRKKGKIEITCPKCHHSFTRRS